MQPSCIYRESVCGWVCECEYECACVWTAKQSDNRDAEVDRATERERKMRKFYELRANNVVVHGRHTCIFYWGSWFRESSKCSMENSTDGFGALHVACVLISAWAPSVQIMIYLCLLIIFVDLFCFVFLFRFSKLINHLLAEKYGPSLPGLTDRRQETASNIVNNKVQREYPPVKSHYCDRHYQERTEWIICIVRGQRRSESASPTIYLFIIYAPIKSSSLSSFFE